MRIALTLGLTLGLAQAALAQGAQDSVALPAPAGAIPVVAPVQPTNPLQPVLTPPPAPSVRPQVLSAADVALYRQIFKAERNGETTRAMKLLDKVSDPALEGYAEAVGLLSAKRATVSDLVAWLSQHRDLAVADRVYRLAVSRSSKRIRKHHKTITVAVVTNLPAPVTVPRRTGGFEDQELPEPTPGGEAGRAVLGKILTAIKAGQPDAAAKFAAKRDRHRGDAQKISPSSRIASPPPIWRKAWTHKPSSWRPALPTQEPRPSWTGMPASPPIAWAAGPTRPPIWRSWRRMAAFRARSGPRPLSGRRGPICRPTNLQRVVSLLAAAAKEEPTFYGLIAERMLGMDTHTGFSDARAEPRLISAP